MAQDGDAGGVEQRVLRDAGAHPRGAVVVLQSHGYAKQGVGYRDIVDHYYRDTQIATRNGGVVRVLLQPNRPTVYIRHATQAGDRIFLHGLAVECIIGFIEWERRIKQTIVIDVEMPVVQSILGSNRLQVQHAIDRIVDTGKKKIGLLGFSFKAGTDDLRESPIVILAEALLGKGYELRIFDSNILIGRLTGANRAYIESSSIRLHGALDGFAKLLQEKQLAVVQSVGYPNPNRSHFESMDIWHKATPARSELPRSPRSLAQGPTSSSASWRSPSESSSQ